MPKRKGAKSEANEEDFISELLDDLKSRGVLEQLRLECVADVKTKTTYLQLKERINDYVTKRMSSEAWTSDNTFREQVVECGVLALTVERIVDEVVSRKLQEHMRPLLIDLIEEHGDKQMVSKLRKSMRKTRPLPVSSFERTAKVVKMICRDTKRDSKKIMKDGLVAHSLASVSFSKSTGSDDGNMSDCSDAVSDLSVYGNSSVHSTSGKKYTRALGAGELDHDKSEPEELQEPMNRSRRERKLNPKYASDVYQTAYVSRPHFFNPVSSTPKNQKSSTAVTNGNSSSSVSTAKHFKKHTKGKNHDSDVWHSESESDDEKQPSRTTREHVKHAHKSSKTVVAKQITADLAPSSKTNGVETTVDSNVRKSSRSRKVNTRIFSDSVQPYACRELSAFLSPKEISREAQSSSSKVTNIKAVLASEVAKVQKPEIADTSNVQSAAQPSTKRYNSADLYKPYVPPSSSRMKKTAHNVP